MAVGADLRVIADAPQQAIGDARRAPAAAGDLARALLVDLHAEQLRGAAHDERSDRSHRRDSAAAACRSGSRRGALTRPCRVVAPMAVNFGMGSECVRAPGPDADQNIDAKIFERRVEHLLDVRQQAMDFVDEEDLRGRARC